MQQIGVLIVIDDPVWADELASLLEAEVDLKVVAVLHDWHSDVHDKLLASVDAALIEIGLSSGTEKGLEAAEQLSALHPSCRMIMLSGTVEKDVIVNAYCAGAVNVITKSDCRDIPEAIRSACRNSSPIHPGSAQAVLHELRRLKRQEQQSLLSPAEKQVLWKIHQGYTHPQIAEALSIQQRTVKNHMNRILKKLKVGSGREAAELARRKGMLGAEIEQISP